MEMNKSISWRKGKKGFTIVELVVVIAVIAILAAVLIPTFVGLIQKANESTAFMDANNLVTTLIPELLDGENDTDLLIFSAKGGKIYVYGFRHDIRRVLPYWNNGTFELASGTSFADQVSAILDGFTQNGSNAGNNQKACVTKRDDVTVDDWRSHDKLAAMLTSNGFNGSTMAIRADYRILDNFFNTDDISSGGCDHNWQEISGTDTATCTEAGTAQVQCSKCKEFGTINTPAKGHDYVYTSSGTTSHTVTCKRCDLNTTEAHDFDADGKCTKCNYQKQKTLTLTGTYDASTKEIAFTIPAGTPADTIITLDFSGDAMDRINSMVSGNEQAQGGSIGGCGVRIIDNSGNNFKISGVNFENDKLKQYMEPDGSYELPSMYVPVITKSTDFIEYMATIVHTPVNETTVAQYMSDYQSGKLEGKTFTDYLKGKYHVTELSDIPFMKIYNNATLSGFPGFENSPWASAEYDGLAQGDIVAAALRHVEPEIIKLLTDNLYDDSVVYSFVGDAYKTAYNKYNNAINGDPNGDLYTFVNDTWKADCAAKGFDAHSLIELMNGERVPDGLNFSQNTADGVTTTSGTILCWWHGFTAANAFQVITILGLTSMQITMTAE